jgi:ADP-heptose:LPS heptosyltransferase
VRHFVSLVPDVHRIAVLRANALGDYLFVVPALEALRAAYPDAEIVLLGAPWHAEVLTGRPGPVDRVLVAPAGPGIRGPIPDDPVPAERRPAFLDRARAERLDLALQLHGGGGNSNPLVAALGARVTAGLRAPGAPALDRTVAYTNFQPEVFRYLEAVGLVGADPVTYRPRFAVTDADRKAAEAAAPTRNGEPRVVIHPGATDARRRWPAARFATVARALLADGADVVVTGQPDERGLVDEVCAGAGPRARPLIGALGVGGLAALLEGAALVVANDTGPLHLAAAVGTPVVGVFWVGNLINSAPVDRDTCRAVVSWTMHCPLCGTPSNGDLYPDRGAPAPCRHRVTFVADVPIAEVLAEAQDLIGSRW